VLIENGSFHVGIFGIYLGTIIGIKLSPIGSIGSIALG
jgi:hypothetical protein